MGKYTLKVEAQFEAAHCLAGHPGKCSRLHGHAWKVEATVEGTELDHIGCLVDFSLLRESLGRVCDALDHRLLNELAPFAGKNPTAENLAAHIYGEMQGDLARLPKVRLREITVWESAGAAATYREE